MLARERPVGYGYNGGYNNCTAVDSTCPGVIMHGARCDCGVPKNVVVDRAAGDMICTDCGVVIEAHMIDESPDWFGPTEDGKPDNRRAGPAQACHDITNLASTTIDMSKHVRKFVAAQERVPGERVALDGFRLVDSLAACLRFAGNVVDTAKEVMRDACLTNARIGPLNVLAASCLYYGCKMQNQQGVSRRKREIASMCGVDETELNAVNKALKRALEGQPYHTAMFSSVRAGDLIFRTVDRLGLDPRDGNRVKRRASDLDARVRDLELLEGKTPGGICSALIYAAMKIEGLAPSKKTVTEACQVSCVTLNKVLKQLHAAKLVNFDK